LTAGPPVFLHVDPPRLESSPWRERLELAATKRHYVVAWYRTGGPGWIGLRCEVRDRDCQLRSVGGLTKLAHMTDIATLAEGVAQWIMDRGGEEIAIFNSNGGSSSASTSRSR